LQNVYKRLHNFFCILHVTTTLRTANLLHNLPFDFTLVKKWSLADCIMTPLVHKDCY